MPQNRSHVQIEGEIQKILDEVAEINKQEDEEFGLQNRSDELPKELQDKERRLRRFLEERLCRTSKNKLEGRAMGEDS